jgi:DNA modification methylase
MIHHGDCLIVLPTLEAESVDACVTDPPYGLAFMGKQWDHGVPNEVCWREVSRVLKPGSYLLAFGGTRTFHRLACALEDAGFEVRDCLSWLYGSGFPKSLNIGGGWGTALKPGWEPIVMARKALRGTVAANVQRFGTGAINVDGCRIEPDASSLRVRHNAGNSGRIPGWATGKRESDSGGSPLGRWPANVVLDEDAAAALDEMSGEAGGGFGRRGGGGSVYGVNRTFQGDGRVVGYGDSGGASRFFFVAAPGCALCDATTDRRGIMSEWRNTPASSAERSSRTIHQTLGSIAPAHVLTSLIESLALRVPYAESLCDQCATRIALALVEIRHSGSKKQASAVFQGCTPESKSSILTRSLASFAGLWADTDIIPTTESLSLLCGSVLHAIGSSTNSTSPVSDSAHPRFLYSAKPSREERDLGCDGLPRRSGGDLCDRADGSAGLNNPRAGAGRSSGGRNTHPTVKPLALMRWLVRLVTPPGGVVLDPFTGSGTTGMACAAENFRFIGIEREAEYVAIAERRIAAIAPLFGEATA